jgi:hypothetical protein
MQHTIKVNVSNCTEISSTENITVLRLPFSIDGFDILYEDYEFEKAMLCKVDENGKSVFDKEENYTITYDIEGNIIITIGEYEEENE